MSEGFWKYLENVWDDDKEYPAPVGTFAIVHKAGWPYPCFAKLMIGTEDDGVFEGQRVWYDEGDDTYLPSVSHWMHAPPKPI